MKETQTKAIIRHMMTIGPITSLIAVREYGCLRLAARIDDIKKMGLIVYSRRTTSNGKNYSEYALVENE